MTSDDPTTPDDLDAMRVRKANDRGLSYGEPRVIHETSKKRVTVMPFFVNRSAGREVSFKITTEERTKDAAGLFAWFGAEQKSLSLNEAAATALAESIRRGIGVAREGADGEFITIRVQEGIADLSSLDPQTVSRAILSVLAKREIVDHLANQDLGPELVNALRGAIRLRELRSALGQLRAMLTAGEVAEAKYQEWCEKHSWAFGSATLVPDTVRQFALGDSVDFLVPSTLTGLRDLIELKRPDHVVLRHDATHRDWYWSSDVSKAIGQCHRYLDALQEAAQHGLRDHPENVAYHPRATIVIGRSAGWSRDVLLALHGLNARLSGIQVMTYDQLLAQAERVIDSVAGAVGTAVDQEDEEDPPPW